MDVVNYVMDFSVSVLTTEITDKSYANKRKFSKFDDHRIWGTFLDVNSQSCI